MDFESCATAVTTIAASLSDAEKTNVYGLYKQGTVGDLSVDAVEPGFFEFKAKAKYYAWQAQRGKTTEEAKAEYVALVQELITTHRAATPVVPT
jgi:diazepam-binding inhibitor (GABA receptor modulating acyl-CoA-binding protein)